MIRHEPGPALGTDCNAISVTLQPMGDASLPTCEMHYDIPVVEFRGEGVHGKVALLLGNVTDPAGYLRRLSRQLAAFAAQVDAARDERMPENAR